MFAKFNIICAVICADIVVAVAMNVQPPGNGFNLPITTENQSNLHEPLTSTTTTVKSISSNETIHINHNKTTHHTVTSAADLSTKPAITTPASEVSDMTKNYKYEGGNDVDEVGKGNNNLDRPPKEDSKTQTKPLKTNNTTETSINSTTATIVETQTSAVTTTAAVPLSTTLQAAKPDGVSMSMEGKSTNQSSTAAGIVALICVGIASFAFVSLLAWRYVYRRRHGNREILINEEDVDFNDEDLRHFEATCIQLEPEA